jgi:hypothetical protein
MYITNYIECKYLILSRNVARTTLEEVIKIRKAVKTIERVATIKKRLDAMLEVLNDIIT